MFPRSLALDSLELLTDRFFPGFGASVEYDWKLESSDGEAVLRSEFSLSSSLSSTIRLPFFNADSFIFLSILPDRKLEEQQISWLRAEQFETFWGWLRDQNIEFTRSDSRLSLFLEFSFPYVDETVIVLGRTGSLSYTGSLRIRRELLAVGEKGNEVVEEKTDAIDERETL